MKKVGRLSPRLERILGVGDVGVIANHALRARADGVRQERRFPRARTAEEAEVSTREGVEGRMEFSDGAHDRLVSHFVERELVATTKLNAVAPSNSRKQRVP